MSYFDIICIQKNIDNAAKAQLESSLPNLHKLDRVSFRVLEELLVMSRSFEMIYASQDTIAKAAGISRCTANVKLKLLSQLRFIDKFDRKSTLKKRSTCGIFVCGIFNDPDYRDELAVLFPILRYVNPQGLITKGHLNVLNLKEHSRMYRYLTEEEIHLYNTLVKPTNKLTNKIPLHNSCVELPNKINLLKELGYVNNPLKNSPCISPLNTLTSSLQIEKTSTHMLRSPESLKETEAERREFPEVKLNAFNLEEALAKLVKAVVIPKAGYNYEPNPNELDEEEDYV